MKCTFKVFNSVLPHIVNSKKPFPVMIRGRHGIGKSEYVYETAKKLGLDVVERRASQMTEGDILGLPVVDANGSATTWKLPDWYVECCNKPRLMFLDEIDRASIEVRQAIFELGDSRKICGMRLHPDTRIFAACNSGEHSQAQFYQVSSLDPAELDRWWVIELDPSVTDWVEWANQNNVNEDIVEFVVDSQIEGKNVLEYEGQFEDNKVYPSRRSWVRLSDTFSPILEKDPESLVKMDQNEFIALCYGFLGNEVSISFSNFLRSSSRKEAFEKIIENGDTSICKNWSTSQHILFINRIIKSGLIKKLIPTKQIENLAKYYLTLQNELGVKLWSSLGDSVVSTKKDIEIEIAIYNFYRFNKIRIGDTSVSYHFIQQFTPVNENDEISTEEQTKKP